MSEFDRLKKQKTDLEKIALGVVRKQAVEDATPVIIAKRDAEWRERLKALTETNGYLGCGLACDVCRHVSGYGKTRGCRVPPIACPIIKLVEEGIK